MCLPGLLVAMSAMAADPPGAVQPPREVVHPLVWRQLAEHGEAIKVWVFFTDKGIASEGDRRAAVAEAKANLDARALERRRLRRTRPGLIDQDDFALCGPYVEAVAACGAAPHVRSRWLNALSATASAGQIREIAGHGFVRSIEPLRCGRRAGVVPRVAPLPAAPRGVPASTGFHGLAFDQLQQIGITDMHAAGFTGAGVVVGVLDTGFVRTHEAYNAPGHALPVVAEWDFLEGDGNSGFDPGDPPLQARHGTIVLGTIGAYLPGQFVGGAYDASFILAKTEDTTDEYELEEDYYVAGLEFIEANGADVATSSLAYTQWYDWFDMDGLTAVSTIGVNAATANGLACCTAAGNGGFDSDLPTLVAPGDAFDVLTCGAVDAGGNTADFSSGGPTADGRVKPEVLARGVEAASVDPDDDAGFLTADGTSMSTPLVASAVALLIQAHPGWTIPQIRTALFQTADYFVAYGEPDPEFRRGYGVIDVFAAAQVSFCTADLDGDGSVGITDLLQLLGAWGPCPGCASDVDGDGSVGITDFLELLAQWGPCS